MLKIVVWTKSAKIPGGPRVWHVDGIVEGEAKLAMDWARHVARLSTRGKFQYYIEVQREGDPFNCHMAAMKFLNGEKITWRGPLME